MQTADTLPSVSELVALADTAMGAGDAAAAVQHLQAASEQEPHNAALLLALGHLHLESAHYPPAERCYARAAELQPDTDTPLACWALALQLQGRTAEAMRAALKALSANPACDIALKVLARISLDGGDHGRARRYCEAVLARNPDDADMRAIKQQCLKTAAATSSPLAGLTADFATRTKTWQLLGPEHVLQQFVVGLEPKQIVIQPFPTAQPVADDGLPVPPVDLRMGYCGNDTEAFLRLGRRSYASLKTILERHQVTLGAGDALLDWGCASGRVLRNFLPEQQRGCAVWGGDVHVPSINWAKDHLPQFRFFNCSALPHLPFPENTFKCIYALSVLTHIVVLRDLWLIELARILRPDGCAILTVHDESTWEAFRQNGRPSWMPADLADTPHLPGECIDIQGSRWEHTYTFFHSDYIRRTWGQYFEVLEIVPRAESYQTAVVLRKRRA